MLRKLLNTASLGILVLGTSGCGEGGNRTLYPLISSYQTNFDGSSMAVASMLDSPGKGILLDLDVALTSSSGLVNNFSRTCVLDFFSNEPVKLVIGYDLTEPERCVSHSSPRKESCQSYVLAEPHWEGLGEGTPAWFDVAKGKANISVRYLCESFSE